tara:strand:+ start:1777 stop:2148 length:372 start_codon:yes stop_codon:yes gene_type:complete
MIGTVLVAVYGTLKKGFGNHGLMAQAQFLGCDTLTQICLYDIGPYPGARLEASAGIEVEVYAISQAHLAELDVLEEYDFAAPARSLYIRALLPTRYGLAWVYLYQGQVSGKPCLRSGTWQPQS